MSTADQPGPAGEARQPRASCQQPGHVWHLHGRPSLAVDPHGTTCAPPAPKSVSILQERLRWHAPEAHARVRHPHRTGRAHLGRWHGSHEKYAQGRLPTSRHLQTAEWLHTPPSATGANFTGLSVGPQAGTSGGVCELHRDVSTRNGSGRNVPGRNVSARDVSGRPGNGDGCLFVTPAPRRASGWGAHRHARKICEGGT